MPNYINRELSWLEFNHGVVSLADDTGIPLFERLKFLSISSSNLDEFFMVRVASIKDLVNAKHKGVDIAGLTPTQQLKDIRQHVMRLNAYQAKVLFELGCSLSDNEIFYMDMNSLSEEEQDGVKDYFMKKVYPLMTPIVIHPDKKFPLISNLDLHLIVNLRNKKTSKHAIGTVKIPKSVPRLYTIKNLETGDISFIMLEDIVKNMLPELFTSHDVVSSYVYRVTRNAELTIEDDDVSDLLSEIETKLKKRKWGEIIRLEVEAGIDDGTLKYLKKNLKVDKSKIYKTDDPIDLTYLMEIYNLPGFDKFKYCKFKHRYPKRYGITSQTNMFDKIKEGDVLLHHPYDTFLPVVKFIKQASEDPDVLAIKQTLYRVSKDSPIVRALMKAAKNGKEVTVVVELKARFDEERNIEWAKKLERAGCHVIYGVPKMKVHSKVCLVLRKEEDEIVYYTHFGTGNYNDSTAKQYTDLGLLTCDKELGEDAAALFNYISGESKPTTWNKLVVSPDNVRKTILNNIQNELDRVRNGKSGYIIIKVNSLNDKKIIDALYKAAEEGVFVHLIVRGICSAEAKTPSKNAIERFRVSSVIGEYLEHSRIFYFNNGGDPVIYCGSADLMPRNLDKRIETVFPITDINEKLYIDLMLKIYVCCRARYLCSNGRYGYETDPRCDSQKLIRNIHDMRIEDFSLQSYDIVATLLGFTRPFGFNWKDIYSKFIEVEEPGYWEKV